MHILQNDYHSRFSSTSITSHSYKFFLVVRTFKISSLSNFQIDNIVLLTKATMLYIAFPGLIYLTTRSLYLLTTFSHFSHSPSPPLTTTNLFCVSMSLVFLDSTYKWDKRVSLYVWLISVSIISSCYFWCCYKWHPLNFFKFMFVVGYRNPVDLCILTL